MPKNKSTEQKIFDAATELFLEKGVDRTSVRDIASKAGINLALMNYYFRSKENLFDAIFSMLLKNNTRELSKILDSDTPFLQKITDYVAAYIDMLVANPLLVSFFLAMLHRNQDKITEVEAVHFLYSTDKFRMQMVEEAKNGRIRQVEPKQFFVDMMSMITFPFAIKYLIMDKNSISEDDFRDFISQRKKHIPEMLIHALSR